MCPSQESMCMHAWSVASISKVRNCSEPLHIVPNGDIVYSMSSHSIFDSLVMCVSCVSAGRGPNTHAYTHSVSDAHHVFLNLQTLRFYCLPDNYEIIGKY